MQNALSPTSTIDVGVPRQISSAEATIVAGILQEFSQYTSWRAMFGGQWEEIAELIDPVSRNTFFYQNYNTPGMKKTQQQVDGTGALALHRFVAIANSLVTPRNMTWHGLMADDPYVMQDRDTKLYFEQMTKILFQQRYAATANFFSQNKNNWRSIGAYGNCSMFIDAFDGRMSAGVRGLRYRGVPLGETFFGENHQGQVDRMIRWFRLTAYQAAQKWGIDALPANLHAPLKQNSQWPYNFLHCVKPRGDDYDQARRDAKGMPWCSYYVSIEGQCLMQREGGYRTFPFAVGRYDQGPGEVYARGPGGIILPGLKTLNAEKTTFLTVGHRAGNPVLLTADDGVVGMDMRPGAVNKGGVTSDGKALVHTLPVGDIQITEKMMGEERSLIDDTFLVSLFKVLTDHPDMTATQVIELVNEKGMLVAPTLGSMFDYVSQMVEREIDVLADQFDAGGKPILPPMPPRLREARGTYRVVDTSPLAQAARMGEAAGYNRWVENLSRLAQETQDPSWMDPVNGDVAAPELAEIYSVPARWTSNDQQIAAKRKARSSQQAEQARIAALPSEAAMVKAQAMAASKGGQPPQGAM